MEPDSPEAAIRRFSSLLTAGDLAGMLAMYEPDASFVPEPGRTVSGRDAIAAALEPMLALSPRMEGRFERVIVAGDTALVAYRWRMTATGPDGSPIEQGGLSADVLRRRADGSWGIQIDDPWGAASAQG